MNNRPPAEYCDHCGEPFQVENLKCFDRVPWNTASANKGESAVLCFDCISNFKCEDRVMKRAMSDGE